MGGDQENTRKRKFNDQDLSMYRRMPPPGEEISGDDNGDFLSLSLSSSYHNLAPPPPPPLPPQQQPLFFYTPEAGGGMAAAQRLVTPQTNPITPAVHSISRPLRARRKPNQSHGPGKSATVPAPFPWATNQRATVHTLSYLLSQGITVIYGDVQCKKCEQQFIIEFDLQQKFMEIGSYVAAEKDRMLDRAPSNWMNPVLPTCRCCGHKNCARPVISDKKKSINWLFLLLGEMLGCCTLDQLKYFCKHTRNHRTGAKDRVLFLTYLGLCKQLDPSGPFDR